MINKQELELIREEFSVQHIYSLNELKRASEKEAEIGHYDGVCFLLIAIVNNVCQQDPFKKVNWLIMVIFSGGKKSVFLTAKDAHVHVMVALDTLINVANSGSAN